jgi:poly-beta-1,6-N-acetyl-D-glucosamine synthase
MIVILSITVFIILLYLAYPLWLASFTADKSADEQETEEINSVSVLLLSFNGKKFLAEKINFLLRELSAFEFHELIIIDDNSSDGSAELLRDFANHDGVKILFNKRQEGIPFSMNLGVATAKYEYVVFSDQRQRLSEGILKKIVEPLKYKKTGAVSGCISYLDQGKKCFFLRRHENSLKSKESKTGSLIGVYGPFYAIKKQCYSSIPANIILDDLYLSLRILKSKQIIFREDCRIMDEDFSTHYDFKRARRYLSGLLQILSEKPVIHDLTIKQRTMLLWHKYLRLLIPVLVFMCYIASGLMIMMGVEYLIVFTLITLTGLFSIIPVKSYFLCKMKTVIRVNVYYFFATVNIFISGILFQNKHAGQPKTTLSGFGGVKPE